jgi:predicted O-methyltransferase YrrM
MISQLFADIYDPETAKDAILNEEFHGFKEDYLVLHCLLRKFKPKSVFEIGCNMGTGTNIICNALPDAKVYSLDLPTELAHISLQHPISEGKGDRVGSKCTRPFTLLRGDSLIFDYSKYPCEAYFIDGEHDFEHPFFETTEILKLKPKLIIWHDSDIPEVAEAISLSFVEIKGYKFYRVIDTRMAYAVRK